jgi:hypothetical protein
MTQSFSNDARRARNPYFSQSDALVRRIMAQMKLARIITEYEAEYPDPIVVAAGETVQVGDEDKEFPGWKWCRASDEREGWVPVELISTQDKGARVLEDYSARELSVKPGEEVTIEEARHAWLLVRNAQGQRRLDSGLPCPTALGRRSAELYS